MGAPVVVVGEEGMSGGGGSVKVGGHVDWMASMVRLCK